MAILMRKWINYQQIDVKPKILTYNGNDVKCLRIFPYGSSQQEVAWSKYMAIQGHKLLNSSPSITLYKANIVPQANDSDPNPWIARAGGSGNDWYNGVAYWGDSLTLTIGSASTGKWPTVTTELWYAPTDDVPIRVYSTDSTIKSGNTYTYVINNVTYNYNVIRFYTSETTIYGNVSITAGARIDAVALSDQQWQGGMPPSVVSGTWSSTTRTITTNYDEYTYAYARVARGSMSDVYNTAPTLNFPNSFDATSDIGGYYRYYALNNAGYHRTNGNNYNFGTFTLAISTSYSLSVSSGTSAQKIIYLSDLTGFNASAFTTNHYLSFDSFTMRFVDGSRSTSFTEGKLFYGTSKTVYDGNYGVPTVQMTWDGSSKITCYILYASTSAPLATISINGLFHRSL